jgi:hypothetical protein
MASIADGNRYWYEPGDLQQAHHAGADTAATVIHAQIRAGMTTDRIEQSAARVLTDEQTHPSPADAAFYRAYAAIATTYITAARQFDLEGGG